MPSRRVTQITLVPVGDIDVTEIAQLDDLENIHFAGIRWKLFGVTSDDDGGPPIYRNLLQERALGQALRG